MAPAIEPTLQTTQGVRALAAGILVVLGLGQPIMVRPDPASAALGLNELWFEIQMSSTSVDWFNEIARPEDIATVTPETVDLLDRVTAGRKEVVFTSIEEAKVLVPVWADRMDIIGFELEQWSSSSADERSDPVGAVQELAELAERHRLKLAGRLGRRFAAEYGAELAPHLDLVALQTQRLQADPDGLQSFALPTIATLRRANPNLEISARLYGEGSVNEFIALILLVGNSVDGVSIIYYSPAALDVAQTSMGQLRSGRVDPATLPTLPELETPATPTPTPTRRQQPMVTPAPLPEPTARTMQCLWPAAFIPLGGYIVTAGARRQRVGQRLRSKDSSAS